MPRASSANARSIAAIQSVIFKTCLTSGSLIKSMFAPSRLQSGACTGKTGIREFLKGYRSFDDLIFCSQLHLDIEAGATQAAVPETRLDPVENLYHQRAVKAFELL